MEEDEKEEEAVGTIARHKFPSQLPRRHRPLGVQRRRQKKKRDQHQQYMPEKTPSCRTAENCLGNSQKGFGLILGSLLRARRGWLIEKPHGGSWS